MSLITLEPGKRGGRPSPCIRGLRITVYDVLRMLSDGMSQQEIQDDFPELTAEDILAVWLMPPNANIRFCPLKHKEVSA
ncbi:MAG: DUF433 domain-containing protein [Pseudomonadaceae bacterium]